MINLEDPGDNTQREVIQKLDLNGFQQESHKQIKISQGDQKQINARIQKWRAMIPTIEKTLANNSKNDKLKQRIRKGIPQSMRIIIWPILAEIKKMQELSNIDYQQIISQQDFPYKQDIAVDLPRTFPNHQMFSSNIQNSQIRKSYQSKIKDNLNEEQKQEDSNTQNNSENPSTFSDQIDNNINRKSSNLNENENKQEQQQNQNQQQNLQTLGQQSLNNVLKAVSLSFKQMGYCQGLNFIAASFLIYVNDEDAFWMMYSLMEKYKCKDIYENIASIHRNVFVFENLLKKFLPKIHSHFEKVGIQTLFYATSWFMTLYSSVLPFNLFARIFDIFLFEHYKIIYRVALSMLKLKENKLLQTKNMDQVMEILRDYDYYQTQGEDILINTACSFIFSKKYIEQLEHTYNQNNITERSDNRPLQKLN